MRRDKKPFVRWISEAVFIFLSVFGAFYFDNLREERNERRLYLNYLSDFRSDLKTNQLRFEKELAVSLDITWGGDYLKGRLRDLNQIDSLLTHPSRINAEMIIDILEREGIGRTSRWIFQSPHYDKLNGDYYSFIKNDALKNRLRLHHRNNQNRYNLKEFIDTEVTYFEYQVVNELDFTKKQYHTKSDRTIWK